MENVKKCSGSYYYTLETLEKKLALLRLLSDGTHTSWTKEANVAYRDLFGVDLLQSTKPGGAKAETESTKSDAVHNFKREDDLIAVSFAPLCRFPTSATVD